MIRNLEYVGSVYAPREDETNYHRGGSAALENNLCCLNHIGQVVADAEAYGCRKVIPSVASHEFGAFLAQANRSPQRGFEVGLADCGRRRALRRLIALAPGWF